MLRHENGDSDYEEAKMEPLILDERSTSDDYHPLLSSSSSSSVDRQNPNSPFDSYTDAVFTSFDHSSNGHRSCRLSSRSDPSTSDYLNISVLDPQKVQEPTNLLVPGGATYYTYLVTTRTNLPEYGGPGSEYSVRRRFKDVVTLADRLAESYRGFVIPVRPDKSLVEGQVMQKKEFVEQRSVALQKYLSKLAAHPVIRKCDELKLFLEDKGKLPLSKSTDVASRMLDGAVKLPTQLFGGEAAGAVDVNQVAQPAKGGRDLLRLFKELKQSVSNDWGVTKPWVVEEDNEFLLKKEKIMEFEQQIRNVSSQAESLVKYQGDMGETMGELGLAFVKLAKFETEQTVSDFQKIRAADMRNVAAATIKASRLYRGLNAQTVKHMDIVHEYLGMSLAINNAFSDRSSALLTVQTLSSDLVSLQSKIDKLEIASSKIFGGDESKKRKIEELKVAFKVTEDAKRGAEKEYERIKENNRIELDRIDKERRDDFLSMLKGFVVNQIGYADKMGLLWDKVADDTVGYLGESDNNT